MIKLRIKEVMMYRDIKTIRQLAELLGTPYSTAHDLYHNKTKAITLNMLDRLCNSLDVAPGSFFSFEKQESGNGIDKKNNL
jgi:DNA-binding Xre family transcriptional regulator